MIQFHKILDGPWDDVRGYLREDLDHLESAFNALARAGTGGGGTWGSITGTLASQADLAAALAAATTGPAGATGATGAAGAAGATGPAGPGIKVYEQPDEPGAAIAGDIWIDSDVPLAATVAVWGGITGTLSTQTDLQNALNLKSGATATSTITTTGTQTALAIPVGTGDLIIRANNATLLNVQGIAAGIDGQRLVIESVGAGQVDFNHQHASATAANRLINAATVGLTSLAAGIGIAAFVYDGTTARWRLVTHEQGAWISPAYSAGDFTASPGMAWTVDAGDVTTFKYRLNGRTLTISLYLLTTSVSGTPGLNLFVTLPTGFKAAGPGVSTAYVYDNGVVVGGFLANNNIGDTTVFFGINGNLTWSASTNNTHLFGTFNLEVQ